MSPQDYRKQGLTKGEQYEVIGLEPASNQLVLQAKDGSQCCIDPSRCDRKNVYEMQQVPIAPSDQLRWTRNDRTKTRRNGQQFVIDAIDVNGQEIARYPDGKVEFIDLRGRQFADYSIVNTTYSSQGKTADRVLVALDKSTGKESFYVAASRAKHELTIYTADEAELRKLAEQSRAKENVSDYLDLFTYQEQRPPNAQNQIRTAQADPGGPARAEGNDRASRGVSIGSSIGSSLAAALQRDSGPQENTGDLERSLATALRRDSGSEADADSLNCSLAEFNRENPIAGIEIEPIAYAVADFVERRQLGQSGDEIADALESLDIGLQQLEGVCQQLAELDQQPDQGIAPDLAEAGRLTVEIWMQLTPRQQLKLIYDAEDHQQTKPRVTIQAEQWIGQQSELKRQLKELSDCHREERTALEQLEERGQRSLLNPFGASAEQLSDARESLHAIKQEWQHKKGVYDQIQQRRNQRQQQEVTYQQWQRSPETRGMQHLNQLLESPEVRSPYEVMERQAGQLAKWLEIAGSVGRSEEEIKIIDEIGQAYLDGRQMSGEALKAMQHDLSQHEQPQRRRQPQRQRSKGIDLEL